MALNVVLSAPADKLFQVPALSVLVLEGESGQVETLHIHVRGGFGDNVSSSSPSSHAQDSTSSHEEGILDVVFSSVFSWWTLLLAVLLVLLVGVSVKWEMNKVGGLKRESGAVFGSVGGGVSGRAGVPATPGTPAVFQTPFSSTLGGGSPSPWAPGTDYFSPYGADPGNPAMAGVSTFVSSAGLAGAGGAVGGRGTSFFTRGGGVRNRGGGGAVGTGGLDTTSAGHAHGGLGGLGGLGGASY